MSDSTTTSTLESFINYKNLDNNVYYKDLSIFEKSIDGKSVLLSYNILNDYRKEIFDFIIPITLTDEEFQKYQYQPKKLAYDLYGSTEYYYMILFINSMTNIKEFNIIDYKNNIKTNNVNRKKHMLNYERKIG